MTHMTHMTHFPYIIPLRVCTRAHTWKRLLWKVRHGATCASCASCQPTNLAGSMGLSEAAAAGRRLASLMAGKARAPLWQARRPTRAPGGGGPESLPWGRLYRLGVSLREFFPSV